ncbi:ABC transporter ATP-binding protein [Atopomonas sediminilitoris]|uniref:ABC transporter ATP-binding protein n=1 Tax=Atopomonas sediminilitoris TaxID=2919919 RepID=UPI001F4EF99E|nr:ABC transporter ATP-binding protein [Atopomonas sediminilitoris]MCJ8169868.1 ABC transporter ATP-binding protein [Atopomonas sediminilitoris]
MAFLNIQCLHKRYADQTLFAGLNLSVERGQLVSLLGPSGCGKSTLLRTIAGLTDIDQGRIELDGHDISRLAPQQRGIGMVFQNYALFPNLSVFANVAFGLKQQKLDKALIATRVNTMLERVELSAFAKRLPHQLSGGQRQRVALARALVIQPRLLLLDEPLSALDAPIRRSLRQQIRSLQQELALTTVFVTHDQEEALTLSDRVVLMHSGEIIQQGSAENVYSAPVSPFAAGFIGHYNLLAGAAAASVLGRSTLSAIAIRPEAIELLDTPQADPRWGTPLAGRILSRQLLGNIVRYQVQCAEVTLICDCLNRSAADLRASGSAVWLGVLQAEVRTLAA